MQSEIPVGSLVLSKSLKAEEYVVGDDIVYFDISLTKSMVTHRIVDIESDNQNYFFQTKGIDNKNVDEYLVPSTNVVGKVILVLPTLGLVLSYISSNILGILGLLVLVILTVLCLKWTFKLWRQG